MPRWPILFLLPTLALAAPGDAPVSEKVIERYKQMLAANPVEGTALDRLWKAFNDAGKTGQLIDEYKSGGTFTSEMITGHLLRKAGRGEDAGAVFARAAKLKPDSPLPLFALARTRLDAAQPAEAAEFLEKATALLPPSDPKLPETLLQLGSAWLAAGDLGKASAAWELIISIDPNNLELRRRLAETYTANHLADHALPHLDFLKKNAPPAERAQALQQLARIHQAAGREEQAIAALDEALAGTAPGNWLRGELESQLVRVHQRYHRTAELEERWKNQAQENPRDLGAQLQLIGLYERLGDLEQERARLEKLTSLAPKNAEYRLRLARLDVQMDRIDRAAPLYDQLLAEQPGNAELVFERAQIDVRRDALPAAQARLEALLAGKKGDDALRKRVLDFYESHRLHAASEILLKANAATGTDEALLALAQFYFAQKRDAEAREELGRLVRKSDPPERSAATNFRIAEILKDHGDTVGACEAVSAAISLQPDLRDFYLLLGDLESTRGRFAEAQVALERAFELSHTPAEILGADQKLFEAIRSAAPRQRTDIPTRPMNAGRAPDSKTASPKLEEYLLQLTRTAAALPAVESWLRVARWQLWNRSPRVAQECAQQALALDPQSIAAHEFLVQLGTNDPRSTLPLPHLEELERLDPAGRDGYRRRGAEVHLQSGRTDDALRIFAELSRAHPGDLGALSDLALAQQRAERWKDSLATWQQILELTPPSRRKEPAAALRRVYDRLGMPMDAARLMLRQIDAQSEEKEEFTLFQELLAHCVKHQLLDWLRDEFAQRRKVRADDYFTAMSYGRILKTAGDKASAFEILSEASFAAQNQAQALPELVREAEDLHKLDAAIRLQTQLLRIVPQSRVDGFVKLAQLQEKAFQTDAAGQTWERVASRFPRDATALQHAVDFQLKWSSPARAIEWLRRIRALEPANIQALSSLAELDADSGEEAEAQACWEEVLIHSTAEESGDPIRFPSLKPEEPGRLQNRYLSAVKMRGGKPTAEALRALRSFWVENPAGAKSDSDLRLRAIRELGRIVAEKEDATSLGKWVERWQAAATQSPGEALWALFYAGASGPLLDLVEDLMQRPEIATPAKQAFIWFALQTREFDRLAAWLHAPMRTAAERDYLLVALAEHLEINGGNVDAGLVEKLFPNSYQMRLWQTATTFAARTRFREAIKLGRRVFDSLVTQRAGYGLEVAHWYLYLGDVESARQVLHASLAGAGEAFEAPIYSALREYFLLLPAAERTKFSAGYLRSIDDAKPVHAAISGALLHGLAGEESAARDQLRGLIALRPISQISDEDSGNSAARYWNFVLNAGVQLQQWGLDSLAMFWWEEALVDEGMIRLQMETQKQQVAARVLEIRTRLTALKLTRLGAPSAEDLIADYARFSGMEGLVPLADALAGEGAQTQSIAILRRLWDREPANPHSLRNLLNACRTAGDLGTLETVLTHALGGGIYRTNDVANRDLTLQLADALEARGDVTQAQKILEQGIGNSPRDSRLFARLAQLHVHTGNADAAAATYWKILAFEAGNSGVRLALAAVLGSVGQVSAAIDLLEKSNGADADTKLAQLYLEAGRMEEAFAALDRLPASDQVASTLLFVDQSVKRGALKVAQGALRNSLAKATDPRALFPLQSKIIELLTPTDDRGLIVRELHRLRRMAGDDAELLGGYFELAVREAPRLGFEKELVNELTEEWNAGTGSLPAGAALVGWRLARSDAGGVEQTVMLLLARSDLTESVAAKVVRLLADAGRSELALQAQEKLVRLNPLDVARMLEWARALQKAGQNPAAERVLEELGWRAAFDEEIAGKIAPIFAELGLRDRAREWFERAIAADPTVKRFRVFLDYARLLTAQGEFPRAAKALRIAFHNPGNREFGEIIAFLKARERLDRFEAEIPHFLPDSERAAAARRLFLSEQTKNGSPGVALVVAQGILVGLGR